MDYTRKLWREMRRCSRRLDGSVYCGDMVESGTNGRDVSGAGGEGREYAEFRNNAEVVDSSLLDADAALKKVRIPGLGSDRCYF